MEVGSGAVSGQDELPLGDAGKVNSISDAVSAAITSTESKALEVEAPEATAKGDEAGVEKTAGDKRDGEDAAAAKDTAKAKDGEAAKDGDAPKTFEAPKHWPEADKQAFAALPPEGQSIVKRLAKDLEGGFTRKSQELGDKARYADAVRGLIDEPTRHQIASSGLNEVQYFAYLDRLQKFAAQDGPGYVKWAMQNLGVSPEQLGIPAKQPDQAATQASELDALLSDPKVKQLESELAQLKGIASPDKMREVVQAVLSEHMASHQRQSLQGIAASFRNAQSDDGQLLYPHFDTVQRHMGALMDADPELARMPDSPEKMKAAYEMAVYARPDLRNSFIEAETAKRVAAAEKAREVARAKSITSVKPGNGVPTQAVKSDNLDDIIRASMSQHRV